MLILKKQFNWFTIFLCSFFLFANSSIAQLNISGPTCVVAGVQYQYMISGSWNSKTSMNWCVTGGYISIVSGSQGSLNGCKSAIPQPVVLVTWNTAGASHTLALISSIGNKTINISFTSTIIYGSISGNPAQTINYNATPAAISCSAATGGNCNPSYSYQWQKSWDNNSWSDISGANSQNLNFNGPLTQTTYYKRRVTEITSVSTGYSNTATVFVNQQLQANSIIPSSQDVFIGSTPISFGGAPAYGGGCNSNYNYQWQSSPNNSSWSDISGGTGLSYNPPALTSNMYYRRRVICGSETAYSSISTVTIYTHLSAGSLSPSNQTIFINNNATQLNATGSSGGKGTYSYQWQISSDGGANYNDIGGATGFAYTPVGSDVAGTKYYRFKTTCGSETVYTNAGSVTIIIPLQSNNISPSSQDIFNNGVPLALVGEPASNGGCGANYSYQWQSSPNNNSWSDIAGATGVSNRPPSLMSNMFYRRKVVCGSETTFSNTSTVLVYAHLSTGSLSPSTQTIYINNNAAQLTATAPTGGKGIYSYQWQLSSDGANYNDIVGATGLTYMPVNTNIVGTKYYRLKTVCGTETVFTKPASVSVIYPPIIPSDVTPAFQIVNTYTSTPIDMVTGPAAGDICSDASCFSYQWQRSPDGNIWTDIAGETSFAYNPGQGMPSSTTYYRFKISSVSGQVAYSGIETIQVESSVIGGPTECWQGQTATYYWYSGLVNTYAWSPGNGAAINGSVNKVAAITIKWTGSGTIPVVLNYNGTQSTTLYVHVKTYPLSPGAIGQPLLMNEQGSSITLNPTNAFGGSDCLGNFSYRWQQSSDGVNFTDITGKTASSMTITPAQNTSYRRKVTCGSANDFTDISRVQLFPYFDAGSIATGNTDPLSWNSLPLPVTGTQPTGGIVNSYTYQWFYSIDGTNFTSVSNNGQGINYQPDQLPVSTWYKRQATNGTASRFSNTVQVNVKVQLFDAGAISPYTAVINPGDSPSLTGTDATGGSTANYNYQWQKSYDEVNWSNAATSRDYSPGALIKTTYFRRITTNGVETGFSKADGAFNELIIKVRPRKDDINIPTTSVQAIADGTIPSVAIDNYTLPSITNERINYLRSRDIEKPSVTTLSIAKGLTSISDYKQLTAYLDDLGRPLQTVAKQATSAQKDLITGVVNYDILGRAVQQYLPYVDDSGNGNFRANAAIQQPAFYNGFYNNQEGYYYTNSVYEKSPLNRIIKKTAPGNSFSGNNIGVRTDYNFNTLKDSVMVWAIGSAATDAPLVTGLYTAGSLVLIVSTDEHENKVMEYKDKEGKTILKKVQVSDTVFNGYTGWLSTYYVYDVFNRLRYVLSPLAVQYASANNWALNQTVQDELCFRYYYNASGNMTLKKMPGAEPVMMVYDARNRLVMMQDNSLKIQGKWMYNQYDLLNRPVLTGLCTNSNDLDYHQNIAVGSVSYPNPADGEVLTQSYYDDYTWVSASGSGLSSSLITTNTANTNYFYVPDNNTYPYAQAITGDLQNLTRSTGNKTKVLGTSAYLYSVSFYDDRGRVQQVQSINYSGGLDTITMQYDFSGRQLRNLMAHAKAGANPQSYKILTKTEYDPAGRVIRISKKSGNSPELVIAENVYDELGQLVKKSIGKQRDGVNTNTYTANPIDSLRYTYNISGWLRGINKDFSRNENNAVNWFGMELDYDFGFNSIQLNGNIAGVRWRSNGDGEQRAYGFTYDNVNRLLRGDFTQNSNGWDNTAGVDYSMKMGNGINPYSAYDANGNILAMTQRGLKLNTSTVIDSLSYGYNGLSNKLNYVTDFANDANSKLGDFKEINNNTSQDYNYDGDGNLTMDNNKAISSISYNYLKLPETITVTGKGTIAYTYDAAGNKLKKVTTEGAKTTTTTYIDGFVYQNDTLQFIGHEEGRIRPKRVNFSDTMYYDYFEKDHLGNVRVVLTDEKQQDIYPVATLEGDYSSTTSAVSIEKNYYDIDASKIVNKTDVTGITDYQNNNGNPPSNPNPNGNATANSEKLYKLQATTQGGVSGLGMTLKVMSGDRIDILGKSYYFQQNSGGLPANYNVPVLTLLSGLLGSPGSPALGKGTADVLSTTPSVADPINSYLSNTDRNNNGVATTPKAYFNYILLDEHFKYVSGGFSRVGNANVIKNHFEDAALQNIAVTKNGYLYVYVSNESPVAVFFDNLQVVHTRGPLVEENHYYPFGLAMAEISDHVLKSNYYENKNRYNKGSELQNKEFSDYSGLEIYTTLYRNLDPQLGRWWQIDPKCDVGINPATTEEDETIEEGLESMSPYTSMDNNPIKHNDPNGDCPNCIIGAIIGAVVDYSEQVIANYAEGKSNPWTSNINLTSIGTAAIAGALTSGGSAFEGSTAKAIIKTTSALINNTVEVKTSSTGLEVKVEKNGLNVVKNTLIDLVTDKAAKGAASKAEKVLAKVGFNSNTLTKQSKNVLKANGVNITRNINNAVKDGSKKIIKVTKKVVESGSKSSTNSSRNKVKEQTNL